MYKSGPTLATEYVPFATLDHRVLRCFRMLNECRIAKRAKRYFSIYSRGLCLVPKRKRKRRRQRQNDWDSVTFWQTL